MDRPGFVTQGGAPPGPGGRVCCTLSPENGPFDRVLDLSQGLEHHYGASGFPVNTITEQSGLIYTCALGFLDLGHVRDTIDLTRFFYLQLATPERSEAGSTFAAHTAGGTVTVLVDIPAARRLDVARAIAYDESVYHELMTYWCLFPGYHNSSFSPEDLVSNLLGTWIGALAIRAMQTDPAPLRSDFDAEVTSALRSVLTAIGAVPREGTLGAFAKITGPDRWVAGSSIWDDFLRRRNFAYRPISPWTVDGVPGCPGGRVPADFAFSLPADIDTFYDIEYDVIYPRYARNAWTFKPDTNPQNPLGFYYELVTDGNLLPGVPKKISKADFAAETKRIKREAATRYGPGFDRPN